MGCSCMSCKITHLLYDWILPRLCQGFYARVIANTADTPVRYVKNFNQLYEIEFEIIISKKCTLSFATEQCIDQLSQFTMPVCQYYYTSNAIKMLPLFICIKVWVYWLIWFCYMYCIVFQTKKLHNLQSVQVSLSSDTKLVFHPCRKRVGNVWYALHSADIDLW